MSLFRSPTDETSSSEDVSWNSLDNDLSFTVTDASSHSRDLSSGQSRQLSIIPTTTSPATATIPSRDTPGHRSILIAAILEQNCYYWAANQLGNRHPIHHPRVIALAKDRISRLSRLLDQHGVVEQGFSSEELADLRAVYRQGLDMYASSTHQHSAAFIPTGSGPALDSSDRIASELSGLSLQTTDFSRLTHSRYDTDFEELALLGKGGYGKVFRVKNYLDNKEYAVKRIDISSRRLARLHYEDVDEAEVLLNEIRTLAGLEHPNIVRYHTGWLEQVPVYAPGTVSRRRLLEDKRPDSDQPFIFRADSEEDSKHGEVPPAGPGIVFEYSSGHEPEPTTRRSSIGSKRRSSVGTLAEIFSPKTSTKGIIEADEKYDEASALQTTSTESTESLSSEDDVFEEPQPERPRPAINATGPGYTLYIQMSLHPISLADYLSPAELKDTDVGPFERRHCYHVEPAIRMLLSVLSGVEYLHEEGVVHRDLKPTNILLSIYTTNKKHGGGFEITKCEECKPTDGKRFWVVPKIGDFGLVGRIVPPDPKPGDPKSFSTTASLSSLGSMASPSPRITRFGTELYRPPTDPSSPVGGLDVYALGVVLFELLYRFDTRMERFKVLNDLNRGTFPAKFSTHIGDRTGRIEDCIRAMLNPDHVERIRCEEVRERLESYLASVATLSA